MAASLFEHGAIRTTEAKAKELRRFVERLITFAKKGTLHTRRLVIAELGHDRAMLDSEGEALEQTVVQKLFDEIAPRYADRPGGYTRIIRLPERRIGDSGTQVIVQLVEEVSAHAEGEEKQASRRKRRAAKRHAALADVAAAEGPTGETEADQAPESADETEPGGEPEPAEGDAQSKPAEEPKE